jgi:hypothetical protein
LIRKPGPSLLNALHRFAEAANRRGIVLPAWVLIEFAEAFQAGRSGIGGAPRKYAAIEEDIGAAFDAWRPPNCRQIDVINWLESVYGLDHGDRQLKEFAKRLLARPVQN